MTQVKERQSPISTKLPISTLETLEAHIAKTGQHKNFIINAALLLYFSQPENVALGQNLFAVLEEKNISDEKKISQDV